MCNSLLLIFKFLQMHSIHFFINKCASKILLNIKLLLFLLYHLVQFRGHHRFLSMLFNWCSLANWLGDRHYFILIIRLLLLLLAWHWSCSSLDFFLNQPGSIWRLNNFGSLFVDKSVNVFFIDWLQRLLLMLLHYLLFYRLSWRIH